MTKNTVASLAARMDARDIALDARFDRLESLILGMTAQNAPAEPAKTVAKAAQPKADGKAYRSAAGKERAKAQVAALWTKTLADAGVKSRKGLTDAQFAEYQAGAKAIWAAVPKTRSTKA